MQRKVIKYSIAAIAIVFIVFNSVYFRKLSEVSAENAVHEFDATSYADRYWEEEIIPSVSNAIEFSELLNQLNQDPELAFREHSHALGIGNIRYFMVKGKGKVVSINANDVILDIHSGTNKTQIHLATEFVYGNAVRDAVGAIDLNEFTNTMDLNKVSAEINKRIRQHIIPPFKNQVKINAVVNFAGAVELNQKFLDLESIELIPVSLKWTDYDPLKR